MTILVLGGSGFIGARAVGRLASRGNNVLSYDVIQSGGPQDNSRYVRADILDPLSLGTVFFENDIEAVVHLVGLPDIAQCEKDPQLSFYLNVTSLQNALEPMRKFDVSFIVFASSAAVYGYSSPVPVTEASMLSPNTIYGYHKLIGEQMVKSYADSYGLKYAILRLFNVYGADPSVGKDVISVFIRRALNHQPITVKGPRKFRDFIHVNDVASIVSEIVAQKPDSSVFNVGTGTKVSLGTVGELIAKDFKGATVTSEADPDDGSGICADNSHLKSAISMGFPDSVNGIDDHIRGYVR